SIAYEPPAPPPPSAPSGSAGSHQSTPVTGAQKIKRHPSPVAKPIAEKQGHHQAASGAAVGAAPSNSVGSEPGSGDPSGHSGSAETNSSSAPHSLLHALGSTTNVGPADVPTAGLLLIALIFIGGTALAAFAIYLLQTGPDPKAALVAPAPTPDDPVEAELQEMIADGMAKQLLSDLGLESAPLT